MKNDVTNPLDEAEEMEAQKFRDNLLKFHFESGNTHFRIPQIGGKELDCYKLYNSVVGRGGFQKVSSNKLWKEVVKELGLPASCTSASFTLKNHYQRCLLYYEQTHFLGGSDAAYSISQASLAIPKASYKRTYDTFLRESTMAASINQSMKNNISKKVKLSYLTAETKRLVLAFESHLETEIKWAINALLIFSCNLTNHFLFENNPFLLDSMTNYVIYCISNITHLRGCLDLFMKKNEIQEKDTKLVEKRRTREQAKRMDIIQSQRKDKEDEKQPDNIDLFTADKLCVFTNCCADIEVLLKYNTISPFELLRMKKMKGVTQTQETVSELDLLEMLKAILKIVRNLSFIKDNEHYISKSNKFIEIILSLFTLYIDYECTLSSLEIISNISKHLFLKDFPYSKKFLNTLHTALYSPEKAMKDLAMECFRKLSFSQGNEEYLEDMSEDFISTLVQCLLSDNPETREASLEVLCTISDRSLNVKVKIAKCTHCVRRLVGLAANTGDTGIEENIAKLAALTLANLSVAPSNRQYMLPYEQELSLIALTDRRISDIICNVLSDIVAENTEYQTD